jgi:hypothetical protein
MYWIGQMKKKKKNRNKEKSIKRKGKMSSIATHKKNQKSKETNSAKI